ncbi:hypothetical protein D1007_34067 [Hordeum vulgare]|nr:hypothetical protein D1007_34067 [Hordeum vulgare]
MADAHGDTGASTEDLVVELQGAVTADEVKDVGGIHGSDGKLATAAKVDKEVTGSSSALPEQKYVSGEDMDVDDGNFGSFKAKEEEKIRSKGDAYYYNRKTNTWRCPYYTTKPKPKSGRFVHLLTHA